ncbi:MAG: asparagine synthase-related protein [Candidatus Aminicenantes bacterium]
MFLIHSDHPAAIDHAREETRRSLLELEPESIIDQIDGPRWSLITARNPFVPYAVSHDPAGAAVVIGSTFEPDGARLSGLRSPSPARRGQAIREYCRHLNFGAALSIDGGEVLVTADWLGLYPVYEYHDDSAFVVTSIPGLLRCHQGFRAAVDIHGLVGILLLAHSCLGLTMFRGVSRLPSGHFLKYEVGGRITRERVDAGAGLSAPRNIGEAVEAFDAVLRGAVGAAVREGGRSIYLSGGLDSRIIAGYLHQLARGEMTAITLGDRRDIEMRAAARVTASLGVAHERVPINLEDAPLFAGRALDEDAMSCGLYSLNEYSYSEKPRPTALTGFLGDPTMGASHVEWGREPALDGHSFHAMFSRVNAWGLSPGVVRELVRADDIDDVISDVWRRLRDEYRSYPGPPWQRSWWFDLLHRQRFIVGRAPKIMALRSWPVLPYVHPDVLRLVQASSLALVAGRKAQIELILRKFPELARLPLARENDRQWWDLVPRKARLRTSGAGRVINSLSWHWRHKLDPWESRVFIRTFDLNGAGWRILRDEARACADQADAWLRKDVVLQWLPPSSTDARLKRAIADATGRKALLGAVLCCSRHFS